MCGKPPGICYMTCMLLLIPHCPGLDQLLGKSISDKEHLPFVPYPLH